MDSQALEVWKQLWANLKVIIIYFVSFVVQQFFGVLLKNTQLEG